MLKVSALLLLTSLLTALFGIEIATTYLTELGGLERTFYGANVKIGDRDYIGLEVGVFIPEEFISTEELIYAQPTLFLLLQLPFKNFKPFVGVSPIIQYYEGEFGIYSTTMYFVKGGLSLYVGPITLTGGANTVMDLAFNTPFGIFSIFAEIGIHF